MKGIYAYEKLFEWSLNEGDILRFDWTYPPCYAEYLSYFMWKINDGLVRVVGCGEEEEGDYMLSDMSVKDAFKLIDGPFSFAYHKTKVDSSDVPDLMMEFRKSIRSFKKRQGITEAKMECKRCRGTGQVTDRAYIGIGRGPYRSHFDSGWWKVLVECPDCNGIGFFKTEGENEVHI